MDSDQLAFVHVVALGGEQLATLLQRPQRVGRRGAGGVGDHHAVLALGDRAHFARAVMVEHVEQQPGALGQRLELVLETDQAAGGDHVIQTHASLAVGLHVLQLALADAQLLHDATLMQFLDVDHQLFDRLHQLAVDFLDDDFRARYRQFEAFATHRLDQHRQVQFTTTGDQELVGIGAFLDLQRDVVQGLTLQPLADLAAGDELAAAEVLATGERRVVDLERHADGRLIDGQRQGLRGVHRAQGVGDAEALDAGNGDDIAGLGFLDLDPLQTHEAQHLQHFGLTLLAFAVDHSDRHVGAYLAALDAADADQAHKAVVVQLADAHLERAIRIHARRRHVRHDRFVQRSHVAVAHGVLKAGIAVQGRRIDDREVQLLVGRAELVEQVENLVDHPVRTCAGTVDLVDHHDRLEAHGERLLGNEARLRHRSVHRVHQDQHRVDHRQHAFDLATKVGVSRGVDDVDPVALPGDGGILGQDRDATFLFLIVAVHHPFGENGTIGERAGLLQQAVNESGLAMIDVGDDGDIAKAFDGHGVERRVGSFHKEVRQYICLRVPRGFRCAVG